MSPKSKERFAADERLLLLQPVSLREMRLVVGRCYATGVEHEGFVYQPLEGNTVTVRYEVLEPNRLKARHIRLRPGAWRDDRGPMHDLISFGATLTERGQEKMYRNFWTFRADLRQIFGAGVYFEWLEGTEVG